MHALSVLQRFFRTSVPDIHSSRLAAVTVAVDAVAQGSRVAITAMGRCLHSTTRIKHRVKRMDRLIGNGLLSGQRDRFYRAMAQRLLAHCLQPIILIDWSDFSIDRQQQLLRARVPVGDVRSPCIRLHPYAKPTNRAVHIASWIGSKRCC